MENQLTDKLLNDQKLIETTVQNNEQLLLSTGNDEYNHIKKAFGLDDTDKVIDNQKRRLIELNARKNQYNSNKIIDEEFLIKFCMDNGYVLTKLDHYKGKLSKEMLKSIDDYCKSTGHSLSSDNHYGFYILCSFNDVEADNYDLKKSKRYSKSQSNKFIILFKLSNGNTYQNSHYDYVYEEGKLNSLTNLKNKLFNVHVNQKFTLIFFIVGLVINLIIYFALVNDIISLYYDYFPIGNIVISIIYSIFFLLIGRKYGWLFDSDSNKYYYHNYDRFGSSYYYICDYISKISNISLSEFKSITIKRVMFTNVIATIILISSLFISLEIHKINYINKVGKVITNVVKTENSYSYDVIERKGLTYKIKTKQFKIKNK